MARRTFAQPQTDDAVVAAALEHGPTSFGKIARTVGLVDPRTARKFVERLHERIAKAQIDAAAAAAAAVVAPPVPLAPEQRAYHEEKLSSDLLVVARQQVSVVGHLLGYSTKLAARIQQEAEHVQEIDPARALTLLNSVSRLVHKVETIGELALRLERVRTGDAPPQIDVNLHVDEIDATVVAQEARALLEALQREQPPAQTTPALPPGAA
jgi:hypothetical protein